MSWRVAQKATETRKGSWVVMLQRSPGRGHEGEISWGFLLNGRVVKTEGE